MTAFHIFGLQLTLTFVACVLIAQWYVLPALKRLPVESALKALVFTHLFRHVGLIFLVPVVVGPDLPREWTVPLAYGDLVTQLLAVVAVIALHQRWSSARLWVWIFNVVGLADLLYAYAQGTLLQVYRYQLSSGWYIVTFIAPVMLVTHALIFRFLVKGGRAAA